MFSPQNGICLPSMGSCVFGPPWDVVRMAVAACLWPTTFKIPSVGGMDGFGREWNKTNRHPINRKPLSNLLLTIPCHHVTDGSSLVIGFDNSTVGFIPERPRNNSESTQNLPGINSGFGPNSKPPKLIILNIRIGIPEQNPRG